MLFRLCLLLKALCFAEIWRCKLCNAVTTDVILYKKISGLATQYFFGEMRQEKYLSREITKLATKLQREDGVEEKETDKIGCLYYLVYWPEWIRVFHQFKFRYEYSNVPVAGTKDGNKSWPVNPSAIKLNNDVYSRKIQSGPFCLRNSFNGTSFRTGAHKTRLP